MPKINSQKGAIEISTIAAMVITATIVAAVSVIATIKYYEVLNVSAPVALPTPKIEPVSVLTPNETADWKTYRNEEYGFEVILLDSWKGYSILVKSWDGTTLDGNSKIYQGPEIIIRNPKWSAAKTWQDIPIMVFTKEEWNLVESGKLNISAAPIGPDKLGENQKYVFALPPRWVGWDDSLGQDEAQKIAGTIKVIPLNF